MGTVIEILIDLRSVYAETSFWILWKLSPYAEFSIWVLHVVFFYICMSLISYYVTGLHNYVMQYIFFLQQYYMFEWKIKTGENDRYLALKIRMRGQKK